MYTIREIEDENNAVTHVWFRIKTLEEVKEIILKRCFKRYRRYHEVRGVYDHWVDGYHSLWHDKRNKMSEWEFYADIGPSLIKRYVVTIE